MPHVNLLLPVTLALLVALVQGEEKTTLQDAFERRTARLGLVPTNSPFAFVDEATGNVTGFDAALSAELCELANLECEIVMLDEFQDRIPALQNVSCWGVALHGCKAASEQLKEPCWPE